MDREIIKLSREQISKLWDGVSFKHDIYKLDENQSFKQIKKIDTSNSSDGDSWRYIIERQEDKKLFEFDVWDAGMSGFIFSDESNELTEVFKVLKTIEEYE